MLRRSVCVRVCVYAHVRFSGSVLSGHLRAGANIGCVNPQWHPLEPARGEEDDRRHQLAAQGGANYDLEPCLHGDTNKLFTADFLLLFCCQIESWHETRTSGFSYINSKSVTNYIHSYKQNLGTGTGALNSL